MSIRFKILIPVCILGILAIFIAFYDSSSMDKMQDETVILQQDGIRSLAALDQISVQMQIMQKMSLVYCQMGGSDGIWGQVEDSNAVINEMLQTAREHMLNENAQEALDTMKARTDNLYSVAKQVKENVDSGNDAQVAELISKDMNAAAAAAEELINEIINYNYADIREVIEDQKNIIQGLQFCQPCLRLPLC